MELSRSESLTLCRRVLSASGLPPGSDEEAAELLVWLALRNYPALEELLDSLAHVDRTECRAVYTRALPQFAQLDGDRLSYDVWITAIDWLAANCRLKSDEIKQIEILNVRVPGFFLPLLRQRSTLGFEFEAEVAAGTMVVSEGVVWMNFTLDQVESSMSIVSVRCIYPRKRSPSSAPVHFPLTPDMHEFGSLPTEGENSRIEVDELVYWKMKALAAECFVPASEFSRQRGAGAEVDDSE